VIYIIVLGPKHSSIILKNKLNYAELQVLMTEWYKKA